MARLIDDQNNNHDEQTTSITVHDNGAMDVDMKNDNGNPKTSTATSPKKSNAVSFRIRQQFSSGSISNNPLYKARKIYVSESTVARLASKFSAADLDIAQGTNNHRSCHSSLNKRFPEKKSIAIRNSSVLETIKFFENDAALNSVAEKSVSALDTKRSNADKREDSSESPPSKDESELVGGRNEHLIQFVQLKPVIRKEKNVKPLVHPKPIILLEKISTGTGKENRLLAGVGKRTPLSKGKASVEGKADPKNFENSHYHAPKLFANVDKIRGTDYQVVSSKNKRLSIAKDFSLESVLNDDLLRNDDCDGTFRSEKTSASKDKTANASFLHTYVGQCSENNKTATENTAPDESAGAYISERQLLSSPASETKSSSNSSVLHDSLMKTLDKLRNESTDSIYEDLAALKENCDAEKNGADHQYSDISEIQRDEFGVNNVYDDVIYAELYNNDDVENYETISSNSGANDQKDEHSIPSEEAIRRSDSDSSFEQTNSLYELKPTSDFSSPTTSTFSSSNGTFPIFE